MTHAARTGESTVGAMQVSERTGVSLRRRLEVHFGALAAVCAVGAAATSEKADASVVYSGVVNINIPSTTAGVYLNVVTGVNNVAPASAPGWDVNPFSGSGLNYFNPAAPTGGVYVLRTGGGAPANLPVGTLIDAASVYGSGAAATTGNQPHVLSANNIVGFRFQNEANGNAVHYGWMRISVAATLVGQPRAIVDYAYENQAGVGIAAGVVPAAGVCCRGATCSTTVTQANCTAPGGGALAGANFVTTASVCNATAIVNTPCCYADYNKVGGITVTDIFNYLTDWFAGSAYARTGSDGSAGTLAPQNIFDFLAAWFAGGC